MEDRPAYEDIVERLAPCGLDCERCARYAEGRVRRLATDLAAALEGFETMVPKVVDRLPVLEGYKQFSEVLALLTQGDCTGCRSGGPQLPFCAARSCFREKEVDFCFQCDEYPCRRNAYPENLAVRWRAYNDRMRDVGVEAFYRESLQRPRY